MRSTPSYSNKYCRNRDIFVPIVPFVPRNEIWKVCIVHPKEKQKKDCYEKRKSKREDAKSGHLQ